MRFEPAREFKGAANVPQILELDCDVLIPAAFQKQITQENAGRVRAL